MFCSILFLSDCSNTDNALKSLGQEECILWLYNLLEETRPRGYKTFSMLNSVEHEIFSALKC